MAKEVKQWITVNGVHVPIYEGESKDDAVKKVINKQKQAGKKVSEAKDSKGKINPVSKELEGRDRTIDGVKYTSEEQAEAVSYMYGVSLTDARQGIVDGKYGDKDIAKSVIYKEMTEDFQTANLATRKKIHEAYEEKIKKLGLDEDKTDKKSNNEHYDTKLNSIRDRLRNGEITPEQAKDEAFEYEKSQRDNKKWSDIDRNRMESKTRDIFKEADAKANASKNEDLKEKQIAQNKSIQEILKQADKVARAMQKYKISEKDMEELMAQNDGNVDRALRSLETANKIVKNEAQRQTNKSNDMDNVHTIFKALGVSRKDVGDVDKMTNGYRISTGTKDEAEAKQIVNNIKNKTGIDVQLRKRTGYGNKAGRYDVIVPFGKRKDNI